MNSKAFSKANTILLLALCAVAIAVIAAFAVRASGNRQLLKKDISKDHVMAQSKFEFAKFADEVYRDELEEAFVKIDDLVRITGEEYRRLHISMWDISYLTPDWYNLYYGSTIQYSNYKVKTPQELCNYLQTATSVNPEMDTIYLGIDPYELYKNYYTSVYYDSEILTFEEYLEEKLFPIFEDNVNINFRLFLPVKPLKALAEESDDEIIQTYKNWYIFLMYLRLYPNVKAVYMGTEEWLVCNEASFKDDNSFVSDIGKQVHLFMYDKKDYVITPPELSAAGETAVSMAHKERNGDYHYNGFEGKKIVFLGDSVFDYSAQDSISIPGYVSKLTDTACYNLSVGGTTAASVGDDSFSDVVKNLQEKQATGRDAKRFFNEVGSGDDAIFIIEYGINDYFQNTDTSDFKDGLTEGIRVLKENYPSCEVMLVSPYRIGASNGGEEPGEEGNMLSTYVTAMEDVSEEENVLYLDLFNNSGITFENSGDFLTDAVHPNINTNLYLARMIVESMVEQNVCDN